MTTALGLAIVVILIIANAFFVAVEFAMVVVDKSRVALEAESGKRPWPTANGLLKEASFQLSGAQVGITISSLVLGYVAKPTIGSLLRPILEPLVGSAAVGGLSIFLAIVLATVIQFLFGEQLPKQWAIAEPLTALRLTARAMHVFGLIIGPAVRAINQLANRIVNRLGFEATEELRSVQSLQELERVIRSSGEEGTLDPRDVTLLTRSIRFGDKTAGDILVPRVELTSVPIGSTLADLAVASVDTGYSRFLVAGDDIDDVRGIVHVKAVHAVAVNERATTPVEAAMVSALFVPETRDLESMLSEMRKSRHQLAVVLDEHGGTAGIVTTEDIVEEIVGEISDEYDTDNEVPFVAEPGSFVVSGSLHHDEVEEICGFKMPEGGFETIAGFALDQMQRLPREGELFVYSGWRIEIVEMDRQRIDTVRLSPLGRARAEVGA